MNIIRRRIERMLSVKYATSADERKRLGSPRRGSYTNGVRALPHNISMLMSTDLLNRLDAVCGRLDVQRGVVMRDAIEFWCGMAEQELGEDESVPTVVRRVG